MLGQRVERFAHGTALIDGVRHEMRGLLTAHSNGVLTPGSASFSAQLALQSRNASASWLLLGRPRFLDTSADGSSAL
jgi:hypothetical protein